MTFHCRLLEADDGHVYQPYCRYGKLTVCSIWKKWIIKFSIENFPLSGNHSYLIGSLILFINFVFFLMLETDKFVS